MESGLAEELAVLNSESLDDKYFKWGYFVASTKERRACRECRLVTARLIHMLIATYAWPEDPFERMLLKRSHGILGPLDAGAYSANQVFGRWLEWSRSRGLAANDVIIGWGSDRKLLGRKVYVEEGWYQHPKQFAGLYQDTKAQGWLVLTTDGKLFTDFGVRTRDLSSNSAAQPPELHPVTPVGMLNVVSVLCFSALGEPSWIDFASILLAQADTEG